jgi:hypothetical protein
MKHSDFRIGTEFLSGSGRWRCTDVGKRTIAAIRLNHDDDPAWYNGPPYGVIESVFDEFDIEGCERPPKRRTYDATGLTELKMVPFAGGLKSRNATEKQKSRFSLWITGTIPRGFAASPGCPIFAPHPR